MLDLHFHIQRRTQLYSLVQAPIILFGNGTLPRNLPMNHLPFRQDSTFLYYTGCTIPDAVWFCDGHDNILFIPQVDDSDALWHGPTPSMEDIGMSLGFEDIRALDTLDRFIANYPDKNALQTTAISDPIVTQKMNTLLGTSLHFGKNHGSMPLVQAIISMRRILQEIELEDMRETAAITRKAHLHAMKHTHVGAHERDIAFAFHAEIWKRGMTTAYQSIVTVDGHILHNHHYINPLRDGQLLLLDGGAESLAGYASDVTRTWPVNGKFSAQQRAAYSAVLEAEEKCIDMVRTGVRYKDIHTQACLTIAEFLHHEKILNIPPTDAVEMGAHALFFPHGVGHLLGLDVHDLENYGDLAAYAPGRTRSTQFGTAYLRLDLDLEANMVVTIEPGFYVVPAILQDKVLLDKFQHVVNWDVVEKWKGFGGIRIEDDVRCTNGTPEVLTGDIPKQIADLESCIGR